jgi:hypothetical protein
VTMRALIRLALAAALGLAAALLVACGGSGKGLIPAAQAGPLQGDFEAVVQAAEAGNGSCAGTETALGKTEKDFLALPATVDAGLRSRLRQGIENLRSRALAMCAQPAPTATTATTPTPETTPETTPTTTTNTATTPATPPPSEEGGGTAAPEEEGEGAAKGKGKGKGVGKDGGEGTGEAESGGAGVGGASPGEGQ